MSFAFKLIISFLTTRPSTANALACFIPIDIAIETAINQSASKVYFAIFPIDFILGANNLNPNNARKKNGIPTAKNIKSPKAHIG